MREGSWRGRVSVCVGRRVDGCLSVVGPWEIGGSLFDLHAGTTDLVAGEVTTALIGLSNTGSKDFIITAIEGSLRFPQDFSYHIQNVRTCVLKLWLCVLGGVLCGHGGCVCLEVSCVDMEVVCAWRCPVWTWRLCVLGGVLCGHGGCVCLEVSCVDSVNSDYHPRD